jgi:hypothetical protein
MLDLTRIQSIAQSYSVQELFAALVWQRRFNEFDGKEVITDLSCHPELWESFVFAKPLFAPDEHGLGFNGLLDTLFALANYRPVPETSTIVFVAYPADTLYILTENRDTTVSQLLDLGKKWRADEVYIGDSNHEEYGWKLKHRLWGKPEDPELGRDRDAVVISYWWD